MNMMECIFLLIALAAVLTAVITVIVMRCKTKKILSNMNYMLDCAIQGEYTETLYDESLLSAVEAKLDQYLSASAVSGRNLTAEKDKIKELIADISHQTKTPIANILLYAQLLLEQKLPPEGQEYAIQLNAQADKLNFLIGSLVKVSRLEAGIFTLTPVLTSLQNMIDSVIAQMMPRAAKKNIHLSSETTEESAYFDVKWTTEAVCNIVDNAIKYTPEGGDVTIRVSVYELFTRIDITDTGIGMKESEYTEIFKRFYRSQAVSAMDGVGIGLYLARQIIVGEGGYVKVKSQLGQGTTFSVFLPCEGAFS